ncbi:DUF1223 domain-containing protein [Shewanella sp. 202IG2-18]|uniref:DUF1223 domain-containing protein n=1 Tax=Parashewanella hymeniacidonis TaxID=2807618 RepID=UPI001960B6C8|nr:DUF1223 domain-containing protein [Parashewanella hymeniacidonis]MBM7071214.1 DUF1223 domain-containing protein [Parashewanella hymeniacidonis]
MKFGLKFVSLLFFLSIFAVPAQAHSYRYFEKQSNDKAPIMIELFSSQGCSSCPPAEEWISTFMKNNKLWDTYFPVSFHVSYWNYLGWKDPFSDRRYSKRQYDHLNLLNIRQVYTPQFVVNSHEWRGWFNRDYDSLKQIKTTHAPKLTLHIENGNIDAFLNEKFVNPSNYQFHLALVGSGFETQVTRGENRSKKLKQDFTVLSFQTLTSNDKSHFIGSVEPMPELSKEAKQLAWVGWIEHEGKVIQAVGDWLGE